MDIGRGLVEATIQDLVQVRDNLLGQRADLDDRLNKLNDRIKQWQCKLRESGNGDGGELTAKRRKKGESLAIIEAVFDALPTGTGLSIRELAEQASLPWSSTRNVLQKHATKYEEREGQWYRKARRERERLDPQ